MRYKFDHTLLRWYYWSGTLRLRGRTRWAPLPWGVRPTDVERDGLRVSLKKQPTHR